MCTLLFRLVSVVLFYFFHPLFITCSCVIEKLNFSLFPQFLSNLSSLPLSLLPRTHSSSHTRTRIIPYTHSSPVMSAEVSVTYSSFALFSSLFCSSERELSGVATYTLSASLTSHHSIVSADLLVCVLYCVLCVCSLNP